MNAVPKKDRSCGNCALDRIQNEHCNDCDDPGLSRWRECSWHTVKRANRIIAKQRKALRAAQHDLATTTGLYCTDVERDGVRLPEGFQLEHPSLALIEKTLKA
ncbi:MAG: hypothetical protein QGD90_00290 [Candidatus Hydrogenedentes bacterium]|nr:hypothetical protein [Candidatus Hydrogenedentota bacterium]